MLPDTAPAEVGWGGGHGCEPQAPRSARNKGRCRPAPHSLFGQPPGTHPMPAGQALSWTGVASLTRALPSQECHSPGKGRQHTSRDAARLQIIRAGFPEEGSFGLKPTLATRMRHVFRKLYKIFWVLIVVNLPSDFRYQIGVSFS